MWSFQKSKKEFPNLKKISLPSGRWILTNGITTIRGSKKVIEKIWQTILASTIPSTKK